MLVDESQTTSTQTFSSEQDRASQYANPITMVKNLWAHQELIGQFTKRDVLQRYRGSYLGLLWSSLLHTFLKWVRIPQ